MVSIVTCTKRPSQIDNIFKNYSHQDWMNKELIIILNRDDTEIETWEQKAKDYSNVSVFQLSEKVTLGECLNFAVSKTKYEIIAKFDDDDYYSPYYITQAMQIFNNTQANIVGKSLIYMYFLKSKRLFIRKAYNPICGATIMFHKRVFQRVQFPAKNTGEDLIFLKKAAKSGFNIQSTNPYNYVCIRSDITDHTWKISEQQLQKVSSEIMVTDNYIPHVIKAP